MSVDEKKSLIPELNELLSVYYSTDDVSIKLKIKSKIISKMESVVKRIAHAIARRDKDPIEDMVQAGYIGILRALENYSKEKNDNFRVYAGYFIIGEMKHFLRDKTSTIRVPAHIQDLLIRINNFTENMTEAEIEQLTSNEVASALSVPQKSVEFAMQVDRRRKTMSLEEMSESLEGVGNYADIVADKNFKEKDEQNDTKIMLKEVFKRLPEDEQKVMDLFYSMDLSQKDIATELGMTQMQVSRNLKHAYAHIQDYFDDKINDKGSGVRDAII